MRLGIPVAVLLCGLMAEPAFAQATKPQAPDPHPDAPQSGSAQTGPAQNQTGPAQNQKPAGDSNAFPEDTNNVPLMPNGNAPAAAPPPSSAAAPSMAQGDLDPVRSPDDAASDASTDASGFSSSATGLDRVMPPPDAPSGKRGKNQPPPEHQETAAEDERVGSYYLSEKNWKAALSRYESAVVLDPENPEVYWGLGEAQRHLGRLAEAKANYEKLVDYDPDSKHGKEAKKLLKDPQFAAASTVTAKQP